MLLGVELPGGSISQEVRPEDKMAANKMATLLLYHISHMAQNGSKNIQEQENVLFLTLFK
jgi:hypothetical protein